MISTMAEQPNQNQKALLRLGVSNQIARKCGIAVYEAEMNLIIHTNNGGNLQLKLIPKNQHGSL